MNNAKYSLQITILLLDMLYIIGIIPINCPVFYEINWTFLWL